MILLITGAGASFDSVASMLPRPLVHEASRPPLAAELFEARPLFAQTWQSFPACLPIIPLLRPDQSGRAVEDVLADLSAQAQHYPEGQRQLLALRFYIQWVLFECEKRWMQEAHEENNYLTLLDAMDRGRRGEDVCIVTFNYDTLLDRALASTRRLRVSTIEEYVNQPPYRLFKLHGSVNWGRVAEGSRPVTAGTDAKEGARILIGDENLRVKNRFVAYSGSPLVVVPEPDRQVRFKTLTDNLQVIPAIAVPITAKDGFECPQEHVAKLSELLPETSRMLMIGWRGRERAFRDLLRKHVRDVPVLVTAKNEVEAKETIATLQGDGIGGEFTAFEAGFTELIVSRYVETFLK